jgi:hypothetical protein
LGRGRDRVTGVGERGKGYGGMEGCGRGTGGSRRWTGWGGEWVGIREWCEGLRVCAGRVFFLIYLFIVFFLILFIY